MRHSADSRHSPASTPAAPEAGGLPAELPEVLFSFLREFSNDEELPGTALGLLLNRETWSRLLTESDRRKLTTLLPEPLRATPAEADASLDRLFGNEAGAFGERPLSAAQSHLSSGAYSPQSRLAREQRASEEHGAVAKALAANQRRVLARAAQQRRTLISGIVEFEQSATPAIAEPTSSEQLEYAAHQLQQHELLTRHLAVLAEPRKHKLEDDLDREAFRKYIRLVDALEQRHPFHYNPDQYRETPAAAESAGASDEASSLSINQPKERQPAPLPPPQQQPVSMDAALVERKHQVEEIKWLFTNLHETKEPLRDESNSEAQPSEVVEADDPALAEGETWGDLADEDESADDVSLLFDAADRLISHHRGCLSQPSTAAALPASDDSPDTVDEHEYRRMLLGHRAKPKAQREEELGRLKSQVDFLKGNHPLQQTKHHRLSHDLEWRINAALPALSQQSLIRAQVPQLADNPEAMAKASELLSFVPKHGFPAPFASALNPCVPSGQEAGLDVDEDLLVMRFQRPFSCLFTLLGHIFRHYPNMQLSFGKVEQLVSKWLTTESAAKSSAWTSRAPDWIALLESALRFMSGFSMHATRLPGFVPVVDFKNRSQIWRWLSHGKDDNDRLERMFETWMQTRESVELLDDASAVTPPHRCPTALAFRKSTPEELEDFRRQEKYQNPLKPFTFRVRDFESSVGPILSVTNKGDSGKVRGHSLLIDERPSCVSVTSLVKDALARLPNGEGTKGEVFELVKESQYVSPTIGDDALLATVHGALDRLRYEKDACNKYLADKKLWIYLHRARTEEDFEKLQEVHELRAKARRQGFESKAKAAKSK